MNVIGYDTCFDASSYNADGGIKTKHTRPFQSGLTFVSALNLRPPDKRGRKGPVRGKEHVARVRIALPNVAAWVHAAAVVALVASVAVAASEKVGKLGKKLVKSYELTILLLSN